MSAPARRRSGSPHTSLLAAVAAAALTALLSLRPASAQQSSTVQTPVTTSGFRDSQSLSGLQFRYYNFETPLDASTGAAPDVLMLLSTVTDDLTSTADIYCNPNWVTIQGKNSPAQPGDAIFYSENDAGINDIYISSEDPLIRPPNLRDNETAGYKEFIPAYNCTVVNNDPDLQVHYNLKVTFNYQDISMADSEQAAVLAIWDKCCAPSITAADRANAENDTGTGDGPVSFDTCGEWLEVNRLFKEEPYVDFCKVAGNVCNEAGHLTTLNFDQWNLACDFPAEEIAQFQDLETLTMVGNNNLTGRIEDAMATLAKLPAIVNVNLNSNLNLKGAFSADQKYSDSDPVCVLAASGLATLNLASTGLSGSAFPPCLLGPRSTLEELRIEDNELEGSIPDNFDTTSPLKILIALGNNLAGPIPESLGMVPKLEVLDLTANLLNGTIPESIGQSKSLRFLYLAGNEFEGDIPSSLALHPTLESLDLNSNQLTGLPQDWYATNLAAINQAPLLNLHLGFNNFEGGIPPAVALLPKLEILNFQRAGLSGGLPNIAGMFRNLRTLNVSYNTFSGPIPARFGQSGIFTKEPVAFASVALFEELTQAQDTGSHDGYLYGQTFDVSFNRLNGAVPEFLFANNVPPWAQPGVNIQGNRLSVDCTQEPPAQLQYIVQDSNELCPQDPPAGAVAAAAGTPEEEAANAPVEAPAGAPVLGKGATSADNIPASSSGKSGLSGGAKAGIAIAVLAIVAGLVAAAVVLHKRRGGSLPAVPAMPALPPLGAIFKGSPGSGRSRFSGAASPTSGFSKFTDVEMTGNMDGGVQPTSLNFNAQMHNGPALGYQNGRPI